MRVPGPWGLVPDAPPTGGARGALRSWHPDLIQAVLAALRGNLELDAAAVTELSRGGQRYLAIDGDPSALDPQAGDHTGHSMRMPLVFADGRVLGSLVLARRTPQPPLQERDANVIRALARIIGEEMERRQAEAADRRRMVERIERVLAEDRLAIVFQPIADLQTGEVVGFEALARFGQGLGGSPEAWFAEAAQVGLGVDLEIAAIRAALAYLDDLPGDAYLSLNVSPQTALAPELAELLDAFPADRLAIELTEHARIDDYPALTAALAMLRARGVRLMVDDVGAGFASLHHILRLAPDGVKLDRSLTSGIEVDAARRALAAALVGFGREIGATIVAEGIETQDELHALRDLGIRCGQGFHLGRPRPLPRRSLPATRREARPVARRASRPYAGLLRRTA